MDEQAITEMHGAEQSHFWFVASRRIILDVLDRHLAPGAAAGRLVDIGCGSGYTISQAATFGNWLGIDVSSHALHLAARQSGGRHWVKASAESLPLAENSVDGLVALDILEYLDDDLAAVMEIRRILKPSGVGVLTVPSWPCLFGPHDVALMHRRRYRRHHFKQLLQHAGLRLVHLTSFNLLLAPAVVAVRLARKGFSELLQLPKSLMGAPKRAVAAQKSDLNVPTGWLNGPLGHIMASERHVVRRLPVRGGISLLAVVKPGW